MKTDNLIMDIYFQTTPAYEVRYEEFDGVNYMIVPVVMMVEGVHSGSGGAVYHSGSELGKIPESWNGIPVTINHPDIDGDYVSANSPEILKTFSVGKIFNTKFYEDGLHAEAWIDPDKIETLSTELKTRIENGELIEVSVGVFSDQTAMAGMFGNEEFESIASNHRPDHLALLPDDVGACSVTDGCGLRVNKKGVIMTEKLIVNENEKILKEIYAKRITVNESGYNEKSNKANQAINNLDSDDSYHYLEEMYDNTLVYRANYYKDGERSSKYFKQTYQENAAGEVELTGEAVQVKRVVDYPLVPAVNVERVRTKFNNNQKKEEMSECTSCVKAAADKLIANKATSYQETDREWLEGMSEEQIEKLNPVIVEKTIEVNTAPKTTEEYLASVPAEVREQVQTGLRLHTERKNGMVTAIMANAENVWTKEELEAMPFDTLNKVQMTANKKAEGTVDYTGMGNPPAIEVNVDSVEVMAPVGVEFKTN